MSQPNRKGAGAWKTIPIWLLWIVLLVGGLCMVFYLLVVNPGLPSPTAIVEVEDLIWFAKLPNGMDEVRLVLSVSVDLRSLFKWNTKKVIVYVNAMYDTDLSHNNKITLWSTHLKSKHDAKFLLHTKTYKFIDKGKLGGTKIYLSLSWTVISHLSVSTSGEISSSSYQLPMDYVVTNHEDNAYIQKFIEEHIRLTGRHP